MNSVLFWIRFLVGISIHKVPFIEMRRCLRLVEHHRLPLTYAQLESHLLAGGRITSLVEGLVYAQMKGIRISVDNAAARDLAAWYQSHTSLADHIRTFEAAGVRDLDSAPLNVALLKKAKF